MTGVVDGPAGRNPSAPAGAPGSAQPGLGERLFARYAHAPNALGYCGPAAAAALQAVACGGGAGVDVRRLARRFSGAWPYQLLIGELTGHDPLSAEVGRAYWTGSQLTRTVDVTRLGELLLDRFATQAGHYWQHLTDDLLAEVRPTHSFHVLGVYPWTRLLATGLPEPLHVLDSCRIRAGQVLEVSGDRLLVRTDTLTWDGRRLGLVPADQEWVDWRTADGTFTGPVEPGDQVALHWGFACDRLASAEADELRSWTAEQIDLTNVRLSRPTG